MLIVLKIASKLLCFGCSRFGVSITAMHKQDDIRCVRLFNKLRTYQLGLVAQGSAYARGHVGHVLELGFGRAIC